jgi:hypothetical protein
MVMSQFYKILFKFTDTNPFYFEKSIFYKSCHVNNNQKYEIIKRGSCIRRNEIIITDC